MIIHNKDTGGQILPYVNSHLYSTHLLTVF
uniref:Uncharacterized protein n=1 Tax=Anguilla anguilla TaxID=7936 RepID=A0A0E9PP55_ANGAN